MMKLLPLVLLCLSIVDVHAIVLSTGTVQAASHQKPESIPQAASGVGMGTDTGARPTSFPFWENIGTVGMGTGVYLGDGWVLTSAHVGCLPFKLSDGTYYRPITQTWQVILNPDGSKSDMALFRVEQGSVDSSLRELPKVELHTSSVEAKTPVILVGTGYVEKATDRQAGVVPFGIQQRSIRAKRWALATTEPVSLPAATRGGFKTHCFATTFRDKASGGQAAEGDSGGAAFIFDSADKQWKLAGCIFAVSQLNDFVPYGARTYVGDLAMYSAQIEERMESTLSDRE